jgi:hypothetical protein
VNKGLKTGRLKYIFRICMIVRNSLRDSQNELSVPRDQFRKRFPFACLGCYYQGSVIRVRLLLAMPPDRGGEIHLEWSPF